MRKSIATIAILASLALAGTAFAGMGGGHGGGGHGGGNSGGGTSSHNGNSGGMGGSHGSGKQGGYMSGTGAGSMSGHMDNAMSGSRRDGQGQRTTFHQASKNGFEAMDQNHDGRADAHEAKAGEIF